MKNIVLQCKDCGAILVVNPKDIWHFIRCTQCDSRNVVNLDDAFDQAEIIEESK